MTTEPETRLIEALDRLSAHVDRLERAPQTGSNTTRVSINAGGVGIWIAVTCCLIMLTVCGIGGMWLISNTNRTDQAINALRAVDETHQAYINAYMQKRTPEE